MAATSKTSTANGKGRKDTGEASASNPRRDKNAKMKGGKFGKGGKQQNGSGTKGGKPGAVGKPRFKGGKPGSKGKPSFKGSKDKGRSDADGSTSKGKDSKEKPTQPIPKTHKERAELKKKRRAARNKNFEMVEELKRLWEKGRQKALPAKDRREKIARMVELMKGKMAEIIFQHDSVRVVQCCVRHGTSEHRQLIFDELKDRILELCKSKYSKHLVPKMLQFGTQEHRRHIIETFYGHVRQLIRQKVAGEVVATAYIDFANAKQRAALVQEFYGPQFALFKAEETSSVEEICEKHPEKRTSIIKHMQGTLKPLLEKGLCSHHIVHKVLLEYFKIADGKDKEEMLDSIRELVVEMLHTKDGSKVALFTVANSSAKDRKTIIKTFKPFAMKIAMEEHGHLVLLGLLDMVDDTVLLRKSILNELAPNVDELSQDPSGRKVLYYLAAHRNRKYFLPQTLSALAAHDGNLFSKKDAVTRRKELLDACSPMMLDLVCSSAARMTRNGPEALLVGEILCNCSGPNWDKAVSAVCSQAVDKDEEHGEALMEHYAGHRLLRTLLDNERIGDSVAERLVEELERDDVEDLALMVCKKGRAAFVLISLIRQPSAASVRRMLAAQIEQLEATSEDGDNKGLVALIAALKGEDTPMAPTSPTKRKREAEEQEQNDSEDGVDEGEEHEEEDDDDLDDRMDDASNDDSKKMHKVAAKTAGSSSKTAGSSSKTAGSSSKTAGVKAKTPAKKQAKSNGPSPRETPRRSKRAKAKQ